MEQGTPLSELGNDGSMGSDNDIVQQIMQDLNRPSQQNPLSGGGGPSMAPPQQMMPQGGAMAPAPSGRMGMMNAPNPNSYMQHAMDPQSGQAAHMIGNSRPTPADFAALMGQGYMPNAMANGAYSAQQAHSANYAEPPSGGNKWMTWIFNELRIPIFVAIVFFLMSLPAANVMFAHLLPSLVTPTGNFTVLGQLARAAIAGVAFWLLHRVLAPLVG
jgi:hypothetical protein